MKRTRGSRSAPVAPAERSVRRRRKAGDDAAESHAPCAPALAHRDILRLIFAYFTRRTCLRSISLVNKRWRSLALESITSLDGLSSGRALALLPGLTHLTFDVSYAVLPETAPTALTSLTIFVNPTWSGCRTHGGRVRDGDPRCRLEAFASLTALATLSLHFFYADAPLQDCALWLLSAHASRLTSLTVRLYTTPESFFPSPPKFRLTATLPALTAFDSNLLIISLRAFLAHHVPRLRTLRLDACTFQDLRSCLPATATDLGPLLTELGVGMSTRLDAFSLHDIPFKRLVRMNLIKREHGITQALQTSMDSEAFERAVAMVTGALLPSGVKYAEWLPTRCPLDPGPVPCLLSPSTEELVFSLLHFSACTHAEVFIALLDYAITHLPRLRLVDMRRCVALPLLVSHQDRLFRVLRGAALHPTLERILLPRYMLTDELYTVVRKKIPHTQL